MKIVLDTNVLLTSISTKSPLSAILDAVFDKKVRLCVSTEILLEYEEVVARFYGAHVASQTVQAIAELSTTHFQEIYFNLRLITNDPDDDKFADCAFAAGADWLVTDDRHFDKLTRLNFPQIRIIRALDFLQLLQQ